MIEDLRILAALAAIATAALALWGLACAVLAGLWAALLFLMGAAA